MRNIISVGLLLVAAITTAEADTLKSLDDARTLTGNVVNKIASGEFEAGLRLMSPYAIVPAAEFEASVLSAKAQWPQVEARFGSPLGTEMICEKKAGESVVRIVQIVKYEKHISRFTFIFYRPKKDWVLNTYFYDDQIQSLFCD